MRLRDATLLICLFSPAFLAAQPIRIASWNLARGKRLASIQSGLSDPRLAAECDILVLQETQSSNGEDLAAAIAAERGWSWSGNASNAIVSRWPILTSGHATIGVQRTRELPWAEVDAPQGPIRVYSVHLTFRNGGWPFEDELRFQEITWILYNLEKTDPPADPSMPIVLAGDFNTVGKLLWGHQREKGLRLLASRGFATAPGNGATHPVFGRLDWIFSRGLQPIAGGVGALSGSDHRWLWAQFESGANASMNPASVSGVSLIWPGTLVLVILGGAATLIRRRRHMRN